MRRDDNRFATTTLIVLLMCLGYAFAITGMYLNSKLSDEKLQKYLMSDTEESGEELIGRIDDLQDQIYELDAKIESVKDAQTDTKRLEMQLEMNEVEKITDPQEYYLAYQYTINKYADYIAPPMTIYDAFSESEIYLLQRMVETETGGTDFESKTHVANVAFNRLMTDGYPNTLSGVITAEGQFAYGKTNISESTKLACEYAYLFPDNTQGALAFHSGTIGQTFCGRSLIFVDSAGHGFYR